MIAHKYLLLGATALSLMAAFDQAAIAQTAPTTTQAAPAPAATPGADAATGEIIVTAQKRSQKLSDVGITIDTATGLQLKSAGVTDVTQLAKIAPGFSVGISTFGYPVFSLRGVNFNASQISAAPAVSTYVDQAVLPYSAMTGGILLDVERVEVLKGPQGTLFGQNATGGSINVIAAKPTDHLAAGFNTEVNNYGRVDVQGYISGPVTDNLRARFAADTTQFGAWQKGYFLNHTKNGDLNKGAARLLLDWTPTSQLKVSLNLNANYDHSQGLQAQLSKVRCTNPAGCSPALQVYPLPTSARDTDIDTGFNTGLHNRLYQAVLRVDYELTDNVTLTSLTNYANYKSSYGLNLDATALPIIGNNITGNDRTINQEVRLTGKGLDHKLNYVIGANYEKDKLLDANDTYGDGYSGFGPGTHLDTIDYITSRAAGVFGNVDYEIIPKLTLTGGVRYTSLKETINGCLYGNAQGAGLLGFVANIFREGEGLPASTAYLPGSCDTINNNIPNTTIVVNGVSTLVPDYQPILANEAQKEHNVSWRAGANYKPTPDTLLYGLASRGYKAGVYPVQANILNSTGTPVKQEELTSYEVGVKLAFLDRAVRLNVSAFYYDYRNKQFYSFIPLPIVGAGSILQNVPKSTVKGIDSDITINPGNGLTLRAAVTYIKTKVDQFRTFDFNGTLLNASGSEFNYAPPLSGTFDAEYRFNKGAEVTPFIGAGGLYNSRTYAYLAEEPDFRIPAYFVFDARVGLESTKGWRVGLFVRNLANKYYITARDTCGDGICKYAGPPRMFGANAGFTF